MNEHQMNEHHKIPAQKMSVLSVIGLYCLFQVILCLIIFAFTGRI